MDYSVNITIGIPVYNAEKFIGSCIESILNQSYKDFEVIISDDSSNDNTVSVIKNFSDKRIKLITNIEQRGISERLNQIIQLSNGKYFARMDADDLMFPDRLRIQIEYLTGNNDIDVLGGDAVVINSTNKILGVRESSRVFSINKALKSALFIHPTIIGKTSWFKENPYNAIYDGAEDYELIIRTIKSSNFNNLNLPVIIYRDKSNLEIYSRRSKMVINILNELKNKSGKTTLIQTIIFYTNFKSIFNTILGRFNLLATLYPLKYKIANQEIKKITNQILQKYCE